MTALSSPNIASPSARHNSVLPTPVGPKKMKLPIGRFGSFRPGAGAANRAGNCADGFVLPNHRARAAHPPSGAGVPSRSASFSSPECLSSRRQSPPRRPPTRTAPPSACPRSTLRASWSISALQAAFLVAQGGGSFVVLMRDGFLLVRQHFLQRQLLLAHVRRRGVRLNAHARTRSSIRSIALSGR